MHVYTVIMFLYNTSEAVFTTCACQVSIQCWPDRQDGATAVVMVQEIESSVAKWLQSLQLRDHVSCSLYWL